MDYRGQKPFRIEFPEFDPQTMPEIPEGWEDISWHNDVAPSFQVGNPEGIWFRVWVDFAKEAEREFPQSTHRFAIDKVNEEMGDEETLVQSDDWAEIVAKVAQLLEGK